MAIAGVLFAQGPPTPYWVGAALSLAVAVAIMGLMNRRPDQFDREPTVNPTS